MLNAEANSQNQTIIFRLTALWALNESGLGGFLHALNFPFSGLIIGSIAVALISFIIYFSGTDKTTLFNALIIVLIIKLLMSPHSSVTAYFAVSFQAVCAYVFYRLFGIHLISVIFVCVLSFLESAVQKLITLTVIGGLSFWNAIDVFVENIGKQLFQLEISNASLWLVGIYFSIYLVFALLSAFFIHSLLEQFKMINFGTRTNESLNAYINEPIISNKKPIPFWLKLLLYSFIIVFVVFTFLIFNKESYKDHFLIYYFLRTISVILFWYYIVMPYSLLLIKKYLNNKLVSYQAEVDEIIEVFPKLKLIILYSWHQSAKFKGFRRLKHFFTLTLLEILSYK
ncbi:MAG: hypothetical protein IPG12_13770 [Saprospiraceae bacterium]|nr:hypothetical protein [Saprospiraceae bacterium]